jgi:two-component sensor histidine kinase/ligand-binding sensor domain-containing protein
MLKILIFSLPFLIISNGLLAQNVMMQDTLFFNHLEQEKGLLQLNIKDMAIDDLGYLWAGTEDGLHKFNGYNFKAYLHNPNDSTTIKDDHIRGLLFTNDTLWIATNSKGITGFIPSQNKFFSPNISEKNNDINTSYKTLKINNQFLLFSLKNNIIVYDRVTKESRLKPLPISNTENFVFDILQIDKNTYWLGTSSSGILTLNLTTLEIKQIPLLQDNSNLHFYKVDNDIYIGTKEGLFCYNTEKKTLETIYKKFKINCFYRLNDGQFYFGTKNGLYKYDRLTKKIISIICITKENKAFKSIDINTIIGDDKGNLWLGTEADGLFHYNAYQKKFNTTKLVLKEYPNKNNLSSFQFLKGKDSTLWIGSAFGIVKYSHINNQFKLYKNDEAPLIYTITRDIKNNIWAGGFTTGLLKYNPTLDQFRKVNTSDSKLTDDDVVEIIPIDESTLWVCTWAGGVFKFDMNTEQFEELLINGERLNRARTSLVDSKGNIWLGTDQGAYKINNSTQAKRYYAEDDINQKISGDRVFSIKEDYQGNIWIGTNTGLTMLNTTTNKTKVYYKQKGLPNDFIYSILISDDNSVWVSTNYGLSKLNTSTNQFTNYTISDGLQNNEFNGKAGYKDEFGNFYFGGVSGINIFNPTKIKENPFLPNIHIENIELFNKPLNKNELYLDELEFKHNENVITFNFAAINYLSPEKCVYTYKLEGFDNDWRPITKNKSTTYTNLNPGDYTFKVKASNDIGLWNEVPDSLTIKIIPPWYQTLIFRILLATAFILSIILFYFYKTSKLKNDKLKLERIIALRTKEIQTKNEDLEKAYNEADKQNNNIKFLMRELTHRVKNNLQIISSLLNIQANNLKDVSSKNALIVAKNRILTISHIEDKIPKEYENIEVDVLIKSICDSIIGALSDDEHLKFKIEYDLKSHLIIRNMNATMVGLILNELLTNTTKYAFKKYQPENILKISCHNDNEMLILTIEDNGKGYDLNESARTKSLGLELVSEMVEQLNGTIHINSSNGTKNTINIPILDFSN